MLRTDRDILDTFASRVRTRFPDAKIWAFGSRARGDANWDSDMDLCVVLEQLPIKEIKDWIGDIAWEIGFENDRILTSIIYSRHAFKNGPQSASAIVANILTEGIAA